jgi:hypothetical protein
MNVGSWFLFSGFFWMCGYLHLKIFEPNQCDKLVFVPRWMFLLFGAPRHRNIPIKVMPVRGVYLQLAGILFLLYGLLFNKIVIKDPSLSTACGLGVCLLISGFIAQYMYRTRSYQWENHKEEDEK